MSVLDELHDIYSEAADGEDDHLDLSIPASRGRLVVRYQAPQDRALINDAIRSILAGRAIAEESDLDLIAACCKEILQSTDGELTPLAGEGERPIRFDGEDKRLGEILGFTYPTAREAVRRTFKVTKFPISTMGHAERLIPFLQGLDEARRDVMRGESEAASAATSTTPSTSTSPA